MSGGVRNLGLRDEVQDPLAFNPRESSPDRSVGVGGVSNPGKSGGTGNQANNEALLSALGNTQAAVAGIVDQAKDQAIVEGKISYQQGKTLQEVQAAGNQYNVQGYESLNAVSKANNFLATEQVALTKDKKELSPDDYSKYLKGQLKAGLGELPQDPAVRKAYSAAFEDAAPRLAAAHIVANAEYVKGQTKDAFSSMLAGQSTASAGATMRASSGPVTQLRISPTVISDVKQGNDRDRDIGIRTILGESGGEGEIGMAAVANVLKNRSMDKRWGGSIADVALAKNQFSAWNTKDRGGVALVHSISPDSPAYQKAGLIYDAVMGGKTVDPTNGATHYYAPKGMQALVNTGAAKGLVPSWAGAESAKNEVRIGNHVFSGKAGSNATVAATGRFGLGGVQPTRESGGLPSPTMARPDAALASTGTPAPANAPPVTAETERQTQLLEGSLRPETQSDRDFLRSSGGSTPGGVKNGTEVNVGSGASPDAVSKAQGLAPTQPKNNTQVRELIMGYNGLPPKEKAVAVADAIRRQLAQGDDTLFNDVGGEAFLRDQLGANPADVDEVLKAHKAFTKESLNGYNSTSEKQRASILATAKAGGYATDDQAIAAVQQMRKQNLINDADAKSLTRDTLEKVYAAKGDSQKLNLDMQDDVANLYTGVRNGSVDAHTAGEYAKNLAIKHNIPVKEVEGIITKIYSEDEIRHKKLEAEAIANAKKFTDEQTTKDLVDAALTKGYGLSTLTGQVTVKDKDTGAEVSISAKQYGVRQLQDKTKAMLANQVQNGEISLQQAGPALEKIVMGALAKQNVVDDDFAAKLHANLTGNIIDPQTKLPREDSAAGFDLYLRMGDDPDIGDAYMNQYLQGDTKALVTTAKAMYDGRLGTPDALLKAHELLSNPLRDPNAKLTKDVLFNTTVQTSVEKSVSKMIGTDSWMKFLLGSVQFNSKEVKDLVQNSNQLKSFIANRADSYNLQHPNMKPADAITMATADAPRYFTPVKGGLVYGDGDKSQRLDQVMGVEGYGKDKPNELIDNFVATHGAKEWGNLYSKREDGSFGSAVRTAANVVTGSSPVRALSSDFSSRFGSTRTPSYGVTYNPDTKLIGISLYNNDTEKQQRGHTMWVRADVLGAQFLKEDRTPSAAAGIWDTVSRSIADTLYGNKKK